MAQPRRVRHRARGGEGVPAKEVDEGAGLQAEEIPCVLSPCAPMAAAALTDEMRSVLRAAVNRISS